METMYFEKTRELRTELKQLEEKLKVKLVLQGRKLTLEGDPLKEYEALKVLEAMQFGFSAKKALILLDEDFVFRVIPIKHFTRRKNMHEVRARIIGAEGKTKRTIENISGCEIVIKEGNELGIIGPADTIEESTTAITNLIKGSKQANVYHFLEKINTIKKEQSSDLGLKLKKEDIAKLDNFRNEKRFNKEDLDEEKEE